MFDLYVSVLFEDSDIVDFVCGGEEALVDTLCAAPVAAPREVELEVERLAERPCVVIAFFVIVEQLFAVDIGYDLVIGPLEGVDVELVFGSGCKHFGCALCAHDVIVGRAVYR